LVVQQQTLTGIH